jgi:hypothetical protein
LEILGLELEEQIFCLPLFSEEIRILSLRINLIGSFPFCNGRGNKFSVSIYDY